MSILLALLANTAVFSPPQINDFVQAGLHDATFIASVKQANQRELGKINESFGQSYKFPTTKIYMKEPFKLRLEAHVEDSSVTYILNGPIQVFSVPRLRLKQRFDLAKKPGRRQTALDFGLLTPSLFGDLFVARFVRNDRATGDLVFDITYNPSLDDTSRNRVWIDPEKHIVAKREWYNQGGRQLATFFYEDPRNVDGIWVPTRLTVKNVEGRVAGVTSYDSIRINTGVNDSQFAVR